MEHRERIVAVLTSHMPESVAELAADHLITEFAARIEWGLRITESDQEGPNMMCPDEATARAFADRHGLIVMWRALSEWHVA